MMLVSNVLDLLAWSDENRDYQACNTRFERTGQRAGTAWVYDRSGHPSLRTCASDEG